MADKETTVTIQQTSKRLKKIRLVGVLVLIASAIFGVCMMDEFGVAEGWPTIVCGSGVAIGALVLLYGWAITWWEHG